MNGDEEDADGRLLEHPVLGRQLTDRANLAAGTGSAVGFFENAAEDCLVRLDDPNISVAVRHDAIEQVMRISADVLTSLMARHFRLEYGVPRRPVWSGGLAVIQRWWRGADAAVGRGARWLRGHAHDRFAARWTSFGFALSGLIAVLLVSHLWVAALVVVVMRLLGSMLAGGPAVVTRSALGSADRSPNLARSLVACLAGHLSDLVLVIAAAIALLGDGRHGAGIAVAAAGSFAMFATLSRIAAERSGVRVTRSPLERVARNGGLVVALGAAAVLNESLPLVVFGAAGCLYGIAELLRIAAALYMEALPQVATTVAVDQAGDIRVWALSGEMAAATGKRSHTAA